MVIAWEVNKNAKSIAATMSGKAARDENDWNVDGVKAKDVTITSITASRRLMMTSRSLQSGTLDASYKVKAENDVLGYNGPLMAKVNKTEFAASLTTELQQVDGLSSVKVDSMATPAAFSEETEATRNSSCTG